MALRVTSIDEELEKLADIYDDLIKPKKIWRNNNNKLYLLLRAFAAGLTGLNDAILALHNRFDPRLCDDTDLYAVAELVGTDFKKGSGSLLCITAINTSNTAPKMLAPGVYNYRSASGQIFSFDLPNDIEFLPNENKTITAISCEKGSFAVGRCESIKLYRSDNAVIDSSFKFSCEDNLSQLGYPDESPTEFRERVLKGTDRQDHIKELELKIRNLPSIVECNLVFNDSVELLEYDGLELEPKELLIIITGAPTDDLAKAVCESVIYDTHKIDDNKVVWYYNDLYINGCRPVYYKTHEFVDFSLVIDYKYNNTIAKVSQVEAAIEELYKPYMQVSSHCSIFREQDAYKVISDLVMAGVQVRNIDIIDSENNSVPFIQVPKTRLLRLTAISFISSESEGIV